jgi:hypothetical protein
MEQARATFLTTYLNWVKPSLLAVLVGVLTTIFSLIGAASNAVPTILKTLNLPECLTYADTYQGTQSDFRKEGDVWREYAPDALAFQNEFTEIERSRTEILLRNRTRRETSADWATLVVYLPVCGGTARMSEGKPERWTDLEKVWKAKRGS